MWHPRSRKPQQTDTISTGGVVDLQSAGFWHNDFLIVGPCLEVARHTNIQKNQREWWILWTFYQSVISSLLYVSEEDKGLVFSLCFSRGRGSAWQLCMDLVIQQWTPWSWAGFIWFQSPVSLNHSLSLSAECSYVHGVFFQLPNVFLWHYLSSPQQKDCRKKRSGLIKVAVWINKALSTLCVAFSTALAAHLFYFSCREEHLNLSQL